MPRSIARASGVWLPPPRAAPPSAFASSARQFTSPPCSSPEDESRPLWRDQRGDSDKRRKQRKHQERGDRNEERVEKGNSDCTVGRRIEGKETGMERRGEERRGEEPL
eukprot:768652-Hanusia_phi.AAC.5